MAELYWYLVRYRRDQIGGKVYTANVGARDADDARRAVKVLDPKFASTVETPRRTRPMDIIEWRGTDVEVTG